jgi:hypothetical protein
VLTRCSRGVRAEGRCVRIHVDGDVWVSVRKELVGGCCVGSPCPEVSEVLLEVRVSVVERV